MITLSVLNVMFTRLNGKSLKYMLLHAMHVDNYRLAKKNFHFEENEAESLAHQLLINPSKQLR